MKNPDEKDPLIKKTKEKKEPESKSTDAPEEERANDTIESFESSVPEIDPIPQEEEVISQEPIITESDADAPEPIEVSVSTPETDLPGAKPDSEPSDVESPAVKPDKVPSDVDHPVAKTKRGPTKVDLQELIDDDEEQKNNSTFDDELDSEDTTPEEEVVNYGLLSKEDLVKLLKEKLDNPGKGNIRKEVQDIKRFFYEKVDAEMEEKQKHFLEEGGNLEDFKPAEEPVETEMKELLYKYKGLKAEFSRQLEKTKQENLLKKQEILEEFRILMEGQGSFESTFRKFKDLQKQWFAAGVVPHQNLKDLWDSYNYFVDKFNDYVRINRDLRALDLKKNLELKEQLCERTEALDKEPNIVHAFKALQKNHTRWREIGPVPRENRDEIWERFKQATSVINRKHQEYHSRLKDSLHENLEKKKNLCEKVENIAARVYETHGAWVEKTNQVLELQKTWKTIGYAPKRDNNIIYSRFRTACDVFFGNKAKFYASAYEDQKDNLQLKTQIAEKAESLKNSQDWKETTNELIHLQKRWKEIGPVPRKDSDKLWRRFRSACDFFFENKSKYFEDIDSTFDENLKAKEKIIAEMDAFSASEDHQKNLDALEDFMSGFNAIGYVPAGKKEWIKDQFRQAYDRLLEKAGLDENQRSLFKFRYRIENIAKAPRSDMKLNFERDKLINKLQQLRNDMSVWENNIGFFKQSDSSEETIQGFQEKIDSARERIELLEEKIRILEDIENEN
jgi:hypothetical protein